MRVLALFIFAVALAGATRAGTPAAELERRLDAQIDPAEIDAWLKRMSSAPNHVGAPHNRENAEWVAAQFSRFGWKSRIEEFQVLYPTPLRATVELVSPRRFAATLNEPALAGDSTSSRMQGVLPGYVAFQGDGEVTAPLVYVNRGLREDYLELERLGISVKGKIVIVRYGGSWRGLKAQFAQERGAVGCILYSDPIDDGYVTDDTYPKGTARPAGAIQRGSVFGLPIYPGDPLTPGEPSTRHAKRLARAEAATILKIPALPISYGDARHFLEALGGPVVPARWRGGLPMTYHVGGDARAKVHLRVESTWRTETIRNVVAVLEGDTYPDEWIMRGNHRDAWVFGAMDPLSGHVSMLAEAKALGALVAQGWRPKRTLVYLSWDAEEPGLMGSTEWVEAHRDELARKGLIYINSDSNGRGPLNAGGSPAFQQLVNDVAASIADPESGATVLERTRAAMQVAGTRADASAAERQIAAELRDPKRAIPLKPLGSGSDYAGFLNHVGIATLDLSYRFDGAYGVNHSAYDTYDFYRRFADPGFKYAATLAQTVSRLVLRLSDADLPVQRYADFADHLSRYVDEVKALAVQRRETARTQAQLLKAGSFRLASAGSDVRNDPQPLEPVPHFNFAPLENAVDKLRASARVFDELLAARGSSATPEQRKALSELTREVETTLTDATGLPFRPWYRNMIYAPGQFTGYDSKTLPGVREAIEEGRWADVDSYSVLTGKAIARYAEKLDEATSVLDRQ